MAYRPRDPHAVAGFTNFSRKVKAWFVSLCCCHEEDEEEEWKPVIGQPYNFRREDVSIAGLSSSESRREVSTMSTHPETGHSSKTDDYGQRNRQEHIRHRAVSDATRMTSTSHPINIPRTNTNTPSRTYNSPRSYNPNSKIRPISTIIPSSSLSSPPRLKTPRPTSPTSPPPYSGSPVHIDADAIPIEPDYQPLHQTHPWVGFRNCWSRPQRGGHDLEGSLKWELDYNRQKDEEKRLMPRRSLQPLRKSSSSSRGGRSQLVAVRSPDGQHRMERVQAGAASSLFPTTASCGLGASISEVGSMSVLGEMSVSDGGVSHSRLPHFGFETERAQFDASGSDGDEHTFGADQAVGHRKGKGRESDDGDGDSGMFVRGPMTSPTR